MTKDEALDVLEKFVDNLDPQPDDREAARQAVQAIRKDDRTLRQARLR